MARSFTVNGETLVKVKLGAQVLVTSLGSNNGSAFFELGLTSEEIRITPTYHHLDINADDFGPFVPPETLWMYADVNIRMKLIHYDVNVLDACLAEATAVNGGGFAAGFLTGAGKPMAGYAALPSDDSNGSSSGCHYVSLNLASPQLGFPWRFRASYLTNPPAEIPLGTKVTVAELNWRCIPYRKPVRNLETPISGFSPYAEIQSSGLVLFDHTLDSP